MANSFVRYTGNGTTTTYAIPFSYRDTADLSTTVAGVNVTAYTLDAAGTNLTFTTAPANGSAIEIRRTTSQNTKLVDYVSGSVLTENDLDTDSDQAFYMSQEAIDKAGDVISLDNVDFNWDIQNKRLKNVADPVDNTDAVNKQFISTNLPNITTVAGISSDVTTVAGISSDVTAVAGDEADIGTVATNIANVNTVATNIADVVTVANDLNEAISEIETAANDLNEATSEIDTVSNNIANVNTVGTDIANVNTVATDIANVNSVAGNSTNINAVAGNETNINAVNANSSNINAVNANSANINTVAGDTTVINAVAGNETNINAVNANSSNINTVAGINADVTTVANDGTDIGTVATNIANVNTVAGNNANITTVAGNNTNITTVAGISSNVTTVANDTADIGTVASDISNVNTVAGSIANVNTVATNVSDVNNFADRYRVQAGEPSVDNDEGDLVYDTTANAVKVYNGTSFDTIQQGITDVAPTRHSIRPSLNLDFANSKVLDPRITFTRASNATYYDGYTSVKAEENLLSYSQEFDNGYWVKGRATITANDTTAPDGTTTAEKIALTSGNITATNFNNQSLSSVSGNDYVVSIYAKAGTNRDILLIRETLLDGGSNDTYFDLSTGTVGTSDAGHTATITDVGNGWYRCSIVFTATSSGSSRGVLFYICETDNSTTVTDDGGFMYLWGAQVEQRDSVTAYTPTTTSPITKYQPALQTAGNNVARFDHNPTTGESLGLLIEESRTNLQVYSEEFDNGAWSKVRTTITANAILAPDGTLTADKLIQENDKASAGVIYDTKTLTLGNDYTFSCYAKAEYYDYIILRHQEGDTKTWFNVSNGTIGTTDSTHTATIEDVGNGWYRCSISFEMPTASSANFSIYLAESDNAQGVTAGTGFNGIYIWGAQLEQGSFPTSYMKTTGSQVTRSDDNSEMENIDTSDWFKQGVGTMYFEAETRRITYNQRFWVLSDGTLANRILSRSSSGNNNILIYNFGTTIQASLTQSITNDTYFKSVLSYTNDNINLSVDGNAVVNDSAGTIPIVDRLNIGNGYINANTLNGHIKKLTYYPKALTDNEIIDLTEE